MRVAALYDIHGNLPALEAVLDEVRRSGADQIVIGGDVVQGQMVQETLDTLLALDMPVQFLHGNCELALLAQMAAPTPEAVTYWGTFNGTPLPEPFRENLRRAAQVLQADYESVLKSWPKTLQIAISGLGEVLFCHSTPRSETEIFTRLTPEEHLLPLFTGLGVRTVVCGHTHMQFDRKVGSTRVVNAGSVGMPFGTPGAYWALLGPDIELRRTAYDLAQAAERFRATHNPDAEAEVEQLLHPPSEAQMLERYSKVDVRYNNL